MGGSGARARVVIGGVCVVFRELLTPRWRLIVRWGRRRRGPISSLSSIRPSPYHTEDGRSFVCWQQTVTVLLLNCGGVEWRKTGVQALDKIENKVAWIGQSSACPLVPFLMFEIELFKGEHFLLRMNRRRSLATHFFVFLICILNFEITSSSKCLTPPSTRSCRLSPACQLLEFSCYQKNKKTHLEHRSLYIHVLWYMFYVISLMYLYYLYLVY